MYFETLTGYITISDLDLRAFPLQTPPFAPCMTTLDHVITRVENTAAEGWTNIGSVSTSYVVGLILR